MYSCIFKYDSIGAPMMECKKALSDASVSGDIEKAMNWLRMKGIARASQGERISQEGLIAFLQSPNKCTLIEVNSETDFVGKNEKFHTFVAMLAQVCNTSMPTGEVSIPELLKLNTVAVGDSIEGEITTIAESLGDIVSQIRENIVIRRALNIDANDIVAAGYVHGRMGQGHLPPYIMMGKTAALVEISVKGKEV
jgi:elongation factor Ts